jgi:general secretion pathway protein J
MTSSNSPPSVQKGFTLLELLISLTIIAVIVVMISGALRIGVKAWEKGEQDIESLQRQRIVLDMIKRQLSSLCDRKLTDKNNKTISLKGDSASLSFLSYLPIIPGNKFGVVYVNYAVLSEANETKRLAVYEKNVVLLEKDAHPNEEEFYDLIPRAHHIEFEYLTKKDEDFEWLSVWDPETEKGIPLAIKIRFIQDAESEPIDVITRTTKG